MYYKVIGDSNIFTFQNFEQYRLFRNEWKENYKILSNEIRKIKERRKNENSDIRSQAQSDREYQRAVARKEMQLLEDAKTYARILSERMKQEEVIA